MLAMKIAFNILLSLVSLCYQISAFLVFILAITLSGDFCENVLSITSFWKYIISTPVLFIAMFIPFIEFTPLIYPFVYKLINGVSLSAAEPIYFYIWGFWFVISLLRFSVLRFIGPRF